MTRLETNRLVLRAARKNDLAPLFEIFSNHQAMQYWSNLPHKSQAETQPTLERLMRPGPRNYFVFDHQGTVIGLGGIHTGTEIGYILHPDHWGQGFASEAARAIIGHIWSATELPVITADVDPRNLNSVRFLTKLGFRISGYGRDTICVGGQWFDSAYFTLPRPEPE